MWAGQGAWRRLAGAVPWPPSMQLVRDAGACSPPRSGRCCVAAPLPACRSRYVEDGVLDCGICGWDWVRCPVAVCAACAAAQARVWLGAAQPAHVAVTSAELQVASCVMVKLSCVHTWQRRSVLLFHCPGSLS